MNDKEFEQFWGRVVETRKQYKLRPETIASVKAILSDDPSQRDLNRFIDTLGRLIPNAREFAKGKERREQRKQEVEEMRRVQERILQLLTVMAHHQSPAADLLWEHLGHQDSTASDEDRDGKSRPAPFEALLRASADAGEWIDDEAAVFHKLEGQQQKMRDSAWFVCAVAVAWIRNMPDTELVPNGNFKKVCSTLTRSEDLSFKATKDSIRLGLEWSQLMR